MKRVLVTGGAGFIGSHLVEALRAKRYSVTVLDVESSDLVGEDELILGSVTDRDLVEKMVECAEVVFHLAGVLGTKETIEQAYRTTETNVLGTLNILDAARKKRAAVIIVTKPNYWRNPYTITKMAAEQFALMYRDLFSMDVRVARCYNVYGPRQRSEDQGYQKAVPTFITRALRKEQIDVYGDGTQGTDHIFISDAVRALLAIFESPRAPEHIVDVGSGSEVSVNALLEMILHLTQSSAPVEHREMRRGESEHTTICADLRSLQRIGFEPNVSLEDGLKATIDYYRERLARLS